MRTRETEGEMRGPSFASVIPTRGIVTFLVTCTLGRSSCICRPRPFMVATVAAHPSTSNNPSTMAILEAPRKGLARWDLNPLVPSHARAKPGISFSSNNPRILGGSSVLRSDQDQRCVSTDPRSTLESGRPGAPGASRPVNCILSFGICRQDSNNGASWKAPVEASVPRVDSTIRFRTPER